MPSLITNSKGPEGSYIAHVLRIVKIVQQRCRQTVGVVSVLHYLLALRWPDKALSCVTQNISLLRLCHRGLRWCYSTDLCLHSKPLLSKAIQGMNCDKLKVRLNCGIPSRKKTLLRDAMQDPALPQGTAEQSASGAVRDAAVILATSATAPIQHSAWNCREKTGKPLSLASTAH
jgi:hypothetical protein